MQMSWNFEMNSISTQCTTTEHLVQFWWVLSRDATGGYARWEARSDHWICWRRASLARQRDYWPRSCWIVDIVSGKPPALYSTCRQATHLGTIQHTGYISPSVATSTDRHNTSTHEGLPATTLSQTQTPWDELWAQVHQSQTQHEQTPNFTQPPLYPLGCPDPLA